jgi:virulence factor Mce-like protein
MNTSRIWRNAIFVSLFAVLCVVGMEFLAVNIGQPNPLVSDYQVHAVFVDADGVPTAADVRVAGVQVGKVTAVSHDPKNPGFSVVTLQISNANAVPVYSNGMAVVRPKTLLGEKYVDLTVGDRGAGQQIPPGGYLPQARTSKDVSNDEIFNAFDAKTRQQQQVVLQELDKATQGRAGDISALLPQLTQIVQDLSPLAKVYEKDNPQVDSIFVNFNILMKTLADERGQLAGLLANGNAALGAIAQRDTALIATLKGYSDVATEFNNAMAPTVNEQRAGLQKLAPTFDKLNQMFSLIIDPQPGCTDTTGKPSACGVAEVFTGTLLGNINYPNDQLTVTHGAGPMVTSEWDSMFSNPPSRFKDTSSACTNNTSTTISDPKCTHSAQNIVLSFHCDEPASMLNTLLQTFGQVLDQGTINTITQTLQNTCNGTPHVGSGTSNSHASASPTGPTATEAAWLAGYST